jgi:hypothetical protein
MRLFMLVVVVLALVATAAIPTSASAAPPNNQHVYDWCKLSGTGCVERLNKVADARFGGVLLSNWSGTPANRAAYAAAAHNRGIDVIWGLGTKDPVIAAARVDELRTYPGTGGYYIADEPVEADHDAVKATAAAVAQHDPGRPRILMIRWWENHRAFWSDIDATLAADYYPVNEGPVDCRRAYNYVRSNGGLGGTSYSVVALQAFRFQDSYEFAGNSWTTWPNSRYPDWCEQAAMKDAAHDSGADLVLWWWLPDTIGPQPGHENPLWATFTDGASRWANLTHAATARYRAWCNCSPRWTMLHRHHRLLARSIGVKRRA